MVLRAKIKSLSGKSVKTAYDFFSSRVSQKPEEYDPENDELHYDRHDHKEGGFRPLRVSGKRIYGVEYLLPNKGDEYYPVYKIGLKELNRIIDTMVEIFEVDPSEVVIHSYTWYNGTDEPCDF
jgi:hypothetical protein